MVDFDMVIAIHEAAHAVASYILHVPFQRITIVPDGKYLGQVNTVPECRKAFVQAFVIVKRSRTGKHSYDNNAELRLKRNMESDVMVSLAGGAAVRLLFGKSVDDDGGSGDDELVRKSLEAYYSTTDVEEYGKALYVRIVNILLNCWHFDAILTLARELRNRKTLDSREARKCIKSAEKHYKLGNLTNRDSSRSIEKE